MQESVQYIHWFIFPPSCSGYTIEPIAKLHSEPKTPFWRRVGFFAGPLIPIAINNVIFELRESCRQINDRKWHCIDLILCHLRSSIFGALTRSNMTLFVAFGIRPIRLCGPAKNQLGVKIIVFCSRSEFCNWLHLSEINCSDGDLRIVQVLTIARKAILHQYGWRATVKRWAVMMVASTTSYFWSMV